MDDSISINTNVNPKKISIYEINTESLERLKKNIEKLKRVVSESFNIQTNKLSMEILNGSIQNSFGKLSSIFEQYDYSGMLKNLQHSFNDIAKEMSIGQLEAFQNIDVGRLFKASFYQEKYDEAGKIAFEYAEEVESEEDISQEELMEVLNEQIEDKIGWQEKLCNKSEEFKRKYFYLCG